MDFRPTIVNLAYNIGDYICAFQIYSKVLNRLRKYKLLYHFLV